MPTSASALRTAGTTKTRGMPRPETKTLPTRPPTVEAKTIELMNVEDATPTPSG